MARLALKKPIKLDDAPPVVELHFREEVCAGDLRGLRLDTSGMSIGDVLKIAGRLCGQTDMVLNKLSVADMNAVLALVGGFLSDGQTTGAAE